MTCYCQNPFCNGAQKFWGETVHPSATDSESRIRAVREFTAEQLDLAEKVEGLQSTVRKAIEVRRRQLERSA